MEFSDFLYEKTEGLARVTFNRPDKLNAFRNRSCRELHRILDDFEGDHSCKVLVLTGAGRAFCAGVDLTAFDVFENGQLDELKAREQLLRFQAITQKLMDCPKPVLAAINGIAIGLGLEIALACDIRLASEKANFAFAEARRALFQTNGVMYLLPRLIGWGRAKELMMTGRTISAGEAATIGLVSRAVPAEEFHSTVEQTLELLTDNAPISLRLIKQIAAEALASELSTVMNLEIEGMMECLRSDDLQEGLRAFEEKRKPHFRGQ